MMHEPRERALTDGVVRAAGRLQITDPATGDLVGRLRMTSAVEMEDAVQRARAGYRHWRTVAPAERAAAVSHAATVLRARADALADLIHRETGEPMAVAHAEVATAAGTLDRLAALGPLHRRAPLRDFAEPIDCTLTEPRGVAVVITPWRHPLTVAAGLIGAALVTGNAVVHKPSERCPHLGVQLGEILADCFPSGVLATVVGDGRSGALLAADPEVDVVAHSGSGVVAQAIAMAAALTGAEVIAEPDGPRPVLIDAGVDPASAAARVAAVAFSNHGRERIYVHRGVAEQFVDALVARARTVNASGELPPLVDRELRGVVAAQVDHAVASGARCLAGGVAPPGPGAFYPATVLGDCTPAMVVMTAQDIGPVAPVMTVDTFDGALLAAASDGHGTDATVLTGELAHARRAMTELSAGTLRVNPASDPADGPRPFDLAAPDDVPLYGPGLLDRFTRTKVVQWAGSRR